MSWMKGHHFLKIDLPLSVMIVQLGYRLAIIAIEGI